jgi:fucose 4-O-acetylase-like acetyltransferase
MKKKDLTIETLRGAVILLVVVGHVIGSASDGGMKVSDDSFLRYIYYTIIDPIQMPLFTILAGWVYALRPPSSQTIKGFISKKVLRIMVPMLVVGVCYFLIQYITPGTNSKSDLLDIWKLLFFPYNLFWYLYSLFMVFIIVGIIDIFNMMNHVKNWFIIFCISVIALLLRDVFISFESPNYLSYKGTLYLLPSFILGVGLFRFKDMMGQRWISYVSLIVLAICLIVQQLSWFKALDYYVHKDDVFGLFIGFTATILLLRTRMEAKWLIWVGSFSYSIYLFHAFGTAGGRIIPTQLHINSTVLIFLSSLATGVLLPIIVDKILGRFKITRTLFLGRG